MELNEKIDVIKPAELFDTHNLTHWYQPIIQLKTGTVIGYEALVRDKSSRGRSPADLFKQAEQENCRSLLDCQLLFEAMYSVKKMNKSMLFMNIFPSTMLEPGFLSWWRRISTLNTSIVLEIAENETISDWEGLKFTINELRKNKVKIAIDDMGSGYSFFRHWIELNPDYIKLDRYYAADLAQNLLKQQVLGSLVELLDSSAKVILEGIESADDLEMAKSLGINFAQGFLLGRPSSFEI